MTVKTLFSRIAIFAALTTLSVAAVAQQRPTTFTPSKGMGPFNFWTNIGSFRILGSAGSKAEGRLVFSFKGTVLIADLEGIVKPSGNVRLEYEHKNPSRRVYFGEGKMEIEGKWSTIQWFGREMRGQFFGWGAARLYGEFDKDLNTGEYWYGNPKEKRYWGTNGSSGTISIPEPTAYNQGGSGGAMSLGGGQSGPRKGGGKR